MLPALFGRGDSSLALSTAFLSALAPKASWLLDESDVTRGSSREIQVETAPTKITQVGFFI